jgi:hypothetical protein
VKATFSNSQFRVNTYCTKFQARLAALLSVDPFFAPSRGRSWIARPSTSRKKAETVLASAFSQKFALKYEFISNFLIKARADAPFNRGGVEALKKSKPHSKTVSGRIHPQTVKD